METKKIFRSEEKISVVQLDQIPNDVVEKRFIMDMLDQLDLNLLKELVGFNKIDFRDKETWSKCINNRYLIEEIDDLRKEGVVKYTCEIYIKTPTK